MHIQMYTIYSRCNLSTSVMSSSGMEQLLLPKFLGFGYIHLLLHHCDTTHGPVLGVPYKAKNHERVSSLLKAGLDFSLREHAISLSVDPSTIDRTTLTFRFDDAVDLKFVEVSLAFITDGHSRREAIIKGLGGIYEDYLQLMRDIRKNPNQQPTATQSSQLEMYRQQIRLRDKVPVMLFDNGVFLIFHFDQSFIILS